MLAHELGHIKRRDPLTQFIVQIACAIHWFNPLVWLAARQMESERERACDDLVLNNGFRASDYAQHLLEIVTGCKTDELEACASVGMARPSRLESRLVSILDERINRRALSRARMGVTAFTAAAAVIPLAMISAQVAGPDSTALSEPVDPTLTQPHALPDEPAPPANDKRQSWDRLFSQKLHTILLNDVKFRDLIGGGDIENAKQDLLFAAPIEPGFVYAVTRNQGILGWDWARRKQRWRIAIEVDPATHFRHRRNRLYLLSSIGHPVCVKLAHSGGVVDWNGAAPEEISSHQLKTALRDLSELDAPVDAGRDDQLRLIKALLQNGNPPHIETAQPSETTISIPDKTDTNYTAYVRGGRLHCKSNDPGERGFAVALTSKENPYQPLVRNGRIYYANDVDRIVCWQIENRDLLWKYDGAFAPDDIPFTSDLSLAFVELYGRPPQNQDPRSLLAHIRAFLRNPTQTEANPPDRTVVTFRNPKRAPHSTAGIVQGWSIRNNRLHFTHPASNDSSRELWSWYHDDVDGAYGVTVKDDRVYIVDGQQRLKCLELDSGRLIWIEDQAQPVSDVDLTRACIELSGARPQSSPPTASDLSAAIADFKQRQLRDLKRRTAERKVRNATNKLNLANRQIRVVRKVGSPEDLANWEKEAKIWEAKIAAAQAELDGILKPKAATPTAKRP